MKKKQGRSFPESTAWFLHIWNKNRGILIDKALGYAWGGGGRGGGVGVVNKPFFSTLIEDIFGKTCNELNLCRLFIGSYQYKTSEISAPV